MSKRAPFHRSKNSMADALLVEMFVEAVEADEEPDTRFFFLTLNSKDFSQHNGDRRLPHADLEPVFRPENCTYATSIVEVIKELDSELLTELDWEERYFEEPRGLSEILEAQGVLARQVWYNRHLSLRFGVENGDIRIITPAEFAKLDGYHPEVVVDEIWRGALAAARKTEEELGQSQLGPWDDFEWGMINGKLSALAGFWATTGTCWTHERATTMWHLHEVVIGNPRVWLKVQSSCRSTKQEAAFFEARFNGTDYITADGLRPVASFRLAERSHNLANWESIVDRLPAGWDDDEFRIEGYSCAWCETLSDDCDCRVDTARPKAIYAKTSSPGSRL